MTMQSVNDLISASGNGRLSRTDWNKITGAAAYTAGRWYSTFGLNGYPPATTFPGTALAHVATTDASGDGTNRFGIPHGGNVSTNIKNLMRASAWATAATGVPMTLKLVDLLGYWPGINMNLGTAQTLTGTPTLRGSSWAGVRAALVITATSGATAHNLSMSYTDQDNNAGAAMPVTVACTASAIVPHITHSGVAANNYGPELPLASGDTGVRNIASVTLSAASGAGTAAMLLYRPLDEITISIASLMSEKDFFNQFPAPIIPDDACLGWVIGAGAAVAANTTMAGSLTTLWG